MPTENELSGAQGFLVRGQPMPADMPRLQRRGPWLCYVVQAYNRCYIDLGQSFEDYKAKFSSKTRATIVRKVKKWAEFTGHELEWKRYASPAELSEFYPLARSVSELTYQERLLDAGLPESKEFMQRMLLDAEVGNARGFILFDNGRPASYLYCPVEDDVVIYAYLGYDPRYLKQSVGTVLQWLALESLFAEVRFKYFDFTEGETDHKRQFATHQVYSGNLLLIKGSPLWWVLLGGHLAFHRSVEWAGAMMDRWGLKARLRRWMRFRGAPESAAP